MELDTVQPSPLPSLFITFIISVHLLQFTEGEIACLCDTPECREVQKSSCLAKYHCFVEYQLDISGTRFLPFHRGCINERTPLNCVRHLPHVKNSHLRTLCCEDSWCNQPEKIPKLIPREKLMKDTVTVKLRKNPAAIDSHRPGILAAPLNPMRIAAPIAAACIVLSFVIFVIFLVKRRESQRALNDLVYGEYDPALLVTVLGGQAERCDRPVLNPRLYNPFFKVPWKASV